MYKVIHPDGHEEPILGVFWTVKEIQVRAQDILARTLTEEEITKLTVELKKIISLSNVNDYLEEEIDTFQLYSSSISTLQEAIEYLRGIGENPELVEILGVTSWAIQNDYKKVKMIYGKPRLYSEEELILHAQEEDEEYTKNPTK